MRYHNYRRQFFDTLGLWTDFLTIISGGGVVVSVKVQESFLAIFFGSLAGVLAALDLVLGFSTKAREHFDLSRRFTRLEQEMTDVGDNPTDENYKKLNKLRLEIEADEPPVKRILDVWCHNELVRALGLEKEAYQLSWLQVSLKQFVSIGLNKELKKVGS